MQVLSKQQIIRKFYFKIQLNETLISTIVLINP
jgi:hypothetical protein